MERIGKSSLFLAVLSLTMLCAFIIGAGFVLGEFQAILFAVILEMCGLFVVGLFLDGQLQQIEDLREM